MVYVPNFGEPYRSATSSPFLTKTLRYMYSVREILMDRRVNRESC